MEKEQIILENKKLGIETRFFTDPLGEHGYTENGVIYLNDAYMSMTQTNRHEVLHFFEDSTSFIMIKESVFDMLSDKKKSELASDYRLRYAGLYTEEEIKNGVLDNEIVIDMLIGNGSFPTEVKNFCKNMYEVVIRGEKSISTERRFASDKKVKKEIVCNKTNDYFELFEEDENLFD